MTVRAASGTLLTLVLLFCPHAGAGQASCPGQAAGPTASGWEAYREGNVDDARSAFEDALSRCPGHVGARTGLGYTHLRSGDDSAARELFMGVVEEAPATVDAVVGLGLLAWRRGDLEEVRARFRRVEELDPEHPTAREYLERLPQGLGDVPERPPLVLPDTLTYPARTHGRHFDVRTPDGWTPFYVKGVNLGAALPGRYASQFPDSARYARWIREMAEMGANTVRLYTIHPPGFYEALTAHNRARPDEALRLIHGVWVELPPDDDYLDPAWEADFFREMRRVVDLVHGRADIAPRPGHASGSYTADVSPWVLAYVIGREWEPYSVAAFDSIRPDLRGFQGSYLRVDGGNAMDAWLGRAVEELVAYETETYRTQRPAAYTNWPTLDPLHHPTETTVDREIRIREALGEDVDRRPREYDNDRISLDATLVSATEAYPAGYFAAYHAYPYYPDFMTQDPRHRDAASPLGPSNYFGYLRRLAEHHSETPVVIAEYGVPASLGTAHLHPLGWHHGGHDEASMARIDVRMTREIAMAGMAGGAIFAWIDEWFKKNWLVIDFELPPDRNRMWLNRLDAEQHYGMKAVEPVPAVSGGDAGARDAAWSEVEPLYEEGSDPDVGAVRATVDAAHLWLRIDVGTTAPERLFVGFDVVDPEIGDVRWPGRVGPAAPVGMEFVLDLRGDTLRVLADPPQNPWTIVDRPRLEGARTAPPWPVKNPPPGLFRGRLEQRYNRPWVGAADDDGRYDSLRVVPNRMRFGPDSTEYLAVGYDRGVLPPGEPPDGFWTLDADRGILEVRVPWLLLNVTDPSSRTVLWGDVDPDAVTPRIGADPDDRVEPDDSASTAEPFGTVPIDGIRIVAAALRGDGDWIQWPATGGEPATLAWDTWDEPEWRSRRRPVFEALQGTFRDLEYDAVVLSGSGGVRDTAGGGGGAEVPDTVPSLDSLRAVADTAWLQGEQEVARRAYDRVLRSDSADATALHRVGLMEAWDENYDRSLELFDRLLEHVPGHLGARVDRARVLAWRGELETAIDSMDAVLEDHPGNRRALEGMAQFQSWAGHLDASLETYGELTDIAPADTEVHRARARVLSWASRFEEARAVYDSLLARDSTDVGARLGLARALTFSDRLDTARVVYRDVLERDPSNAEALRGLARAEDWAGDLRAGEDAWRDALDAVPDDVQAMVGLSRNLRWQGRSADALDVLSAAEEVAPERPEVREERRWALADVSPRVRPSHILEADSDGNRMATTSMSATWNVLRDASLRVDAYRRDVEQGNLEGAAQGFVLTGSYDVGAGWTASAGAGGSEFDLGLRESAMSYRAELSTPGAFPYGATLRHVAEPLDATAALVRRGVFYRRWELDTRWSPTPRWRLQGSVGRARFEGSRVNHRHAGALLASRTLTPSWEVGAGLRTFSFEEDLNDGYFDPDLYRIAELTARWERKRRGWFLRLEAAPGLQQIGSGGDATGTLRGSVRLTRGIAPGREIFISAGYSSTGLQSFSTDDVEYRYTAVSVGGSWSFY